MEFLSVASLEKRRKADLLVLPFVKSKKKVEGAAKFGSLQQAISFPIEAGDFKGKEGEVLLLYVPEEPEKRIALLGLGESEKVSKEKLRRAYASLAMFCQSKDIQTLNTLLPSLENMKEEDVAQGVSEGLLLANYAFEKLMHDTIKEEKTTLLKTVCLINVSRKGLDTAKKAGSIAEGVYFARDLVNSNADDVTPQTLAKTAMEIARKYKNVKATLFDKKRIEKEKMGLLLAVNRGSMRDPAFIILEYKGDPKSKDKTVVIGKGITYDTGGLNLKPTGFMETMKCDMSGAATALGVVYAAANLGLKKNITAVIPSTENSIGSRSYKPGDVYNSYAGKTVEIGNTDAEGRLVLADALAYSAKNLKPTRMIDCATLTGAIVVALGEETIGLMTNNDHIAESLAKAGEETYERVWRMPLYEEYKSQLKSGVADIKNVGGKEAASITAAIFLQEFVGDVPWAHLDIAGTAFLSKGRRYHPKYGTGSGVRLLLEFVENLK